MKSANVTSHAKRAIKKLGKKDKALSKKVEEYHKEVSNRKDIKDFDKWKNKWDAKLLQESELRDYFKIKGEDLLFRIKLKTRQGDYRLLYHIKKELLFDTPVLIDLRKRDESTYKSRK